MNCISGKFWEGEADHREKPVFSEMLRRQPCKCFELFGQCAMGEDCPNIVRIGSLYETTSNDDAPFGAAAGGQRARWPWGLRTWVGVGGERHFHWATQATVTAALAVAPAGKKDKSPSSPARPPPFEEDSAARIVHAASGCFVEATSGWCYEPKSKLYYGPPAGGVPGAAPQLWHLCPGRAPSFRVLGPPFQAAAEAAAGPCPPPPPGASAPSAAALPTRPQQVAPDGGTSNTIQTPCMKRKRSGKVICQKEDRQNTKDLGIEDPNKNCSKRRSEPKDSHCILCSLLRKGKIKCLADRFFDENALCCRHHTASHSAIENGDPLVLYLLAQNKELVGQISELKACLQRYRNIAKNRIAYLKKIAQNQADKQIQQSKVAGNGTSSCKGQFFPPAVAEGKEGEMVKVAGLAVTTCEGTCTPAEHGRENKILPSEPDKVRGGALVWAESTGNTKYGYKVTTVERKSRLSMSTEQSINDKNADSDGDIDMEITNESSDEKNSLVDELEELLAVQQTTTQRDLGKVIEPAKTNPELLAKQRQRLKLWKQKYQPREGAAAAVVALVGRVKEETPCSPHKELEHLRRQLADTTAQAEASKRGLEEELANSTAQAEASKRKMEGETERVRVVEKKLAESSRERVVAEAELNRVAAEAKEEVVRMRQDLAAVAAQAEEIEGGMEAERKRANAAEKRLAQLILDRCQQEEKLSGEIETAKKDAQRLKRDLKEAETRAEKRQIRYEEERGHRKRVEKELERVSKDLKYYKARIRERNTKLEAERNHSDKVKKDLLALEKRLEEVSVCKNSDGLATKSSDQAVLQGLQLQLENAVERAKSAEEQLAEAKVLEEDLKSKVAEANELLDDVHEANEAEQNEARKELASARARAEGAEARAEAAKARAEAAEARAGGAEEAAARGRAECGRLAGRADLAEAQAEAAAGAAEAQAKRASAQMALAQGKVMALESKLAAMVNEAERREVALAAAMAATAAREKELAAERTQAAARVEELAAARAEMAARGKELATARAEAADRGEELAAARAKRVAKKKELAMARAEAAARGKELAAARAETAARGKELAAARAQVAAGMEELLKLRAEVKSSRRQPEPGPAAAGRVPLDGRLKLRRLFEDNKWYHGKVLGYNHTNPKESRYLVEFEDGDHYLYGEEEIIRLAVEGLLPISQQLSDADEDKNFGQAS